MGGSTIGVRSRPCYNAYIISSGLVVRVVYDLRHKNRGSGEPIMKSTHPGILVLTFEENSVWPHSRSGRVYGAEKEETSQGFLIQFTMGEIKTSRRFRCRSGRIYEMRFREEKMCTRVRAIRNPCSVQTQRHHGLGPEF